MTESLFERVKCNIIWKKNFSGLVISLVDWHESYKTKIINEKYLIKKLIRLQKVEIAIKKVLVEQKLITDVNEQQLCHSQLFPKC